MTAHTQPSLALIIYGSPYKNRVARTDVDLALAAAALDIVLQVFFSGCSIMQLAVDRNTGEAMLTAGHRAWAALPDLGTARVCAEKRWLDFCQENGVDLIMPVEALDPSQMKLAWRKCQHVLVL